MDPQGKKFPNMWDEKFQFDLGFCCFFFEQSSLRRLTESNVNMSGPYQRYDLDEMIYIYICISISYIYIFMYLFIYLFIYNQNIITWNLFSSVLENHRLHRTPKKTVEHQTAKSLPTVQLESEKTRNPRFVSLSWRIIPFGKWLINHG